MRPDLCNAIRRQMLKKVRLYLNESGKNCYNSYNDFLKGGYYDEAKHDSLIGRIFLDSSSCGKNSVWDKHIKPNGEICG